MSLSLAAHADLTLIKKLRLRPAILIDINACGRNRRRLQGGATHARVPGRLMKILLAVDGSDISTRAAEYVVRLAASLQQPPQVLLVNVDPPLGSQLAAQLGVEVVAMHHAENSRRAMQPAHEVLSRARLKVDEEAHVGPIAATIIDQAKQHGVDVIVMGSRGAGALKGLLLGSVSSRVIADSPVPVTIIR